MPDPKLQRNLSLAATVGVLATCFGCTLLWQNQILAAIIALVVAELILLPLFVYLLSTRRKLKKMAAHRDVEKQEQLDALAGVGDIMATKEEKKQ